MGLAGSKFFDPGRVSHLWFGKFPLKIPNFLPFGSKKIFSGKVKKYPGQSQANLLFTTGQKYGRVRSGPISNLYYDLIGMQLDHNCSILTLCIFDPSGEKTKGLQDQNLPRISLKWEVKRSKRFWDSSLLHGNFELYALFKSGFLWSKFDISDWLGSNKWI